jgi:glucosamine kinase
MNIAVFEAGGSKTEVIFGNPAKCRRLESAGIHPTFMDSLQIGASLLEIRSKIPEFIPDKIFYYGASCGSHELSWKVHEQLKQIFPGTEISVESDLLGTARALCGSKAGFAAILGTGSNACIFDGQKIHKRMMSFGFWLGDEGSGAYLGKKVFRAWVKREVPDVYNKSLEELFQATQINALSELVEDKKPNARIARLGGFAIRHKSDPVFKKMIQQSLEDFFIENDALLSESVHLPFHFSGSVAYHLQDEIVEYLSGRQLTAGIITSRTSDRLFDYHLMDLIL